MEAAQSTLKEELFHFNIDSKRSWTRNATEINAFIEDIEGVLRERELASKKARLAMMVKTLSSLPTLLTLATLAILSPNNPKNFDNR